MGGYGSGGWNARGRSTTGDSKNIDVNYMHKRGFLKPGTSSRQYWTRGGEPSGNINVNADENGLTLIYKTRSYGGDWQDIREAVPVIWEPCHFGGQRPYFLCPRCGRRIAKLYGLTRFLCRSCNHLAYQCQRESAWDRTLRKDWKLRALLGGEPGMDNPIPNKPKGMHWRTYKRILESIYQVESLIDEHTFALVERLDKQPSNQGGFWS